MPSQCQALGAAGTEGHEMPGVSWGTQAGAVGQKEWDPHGQEAQHPVGGLGKRRSAFDVFVK